MQSPHKRTGSCGGNDKMEQAKGFKMMKPDAYIPFYGSDFFNATSKLTDECSMAYLRAIWFYWSDTHAAGLDDNPDELYRICGKPENWESVKSIIFAANGKFFNMREDGKWHQDRAEELHKEVTRKWKAKQNQTAPARKARGY